MELWIRSQDRTELVKIDNISYINVAEDMDTSKHILWNDCREKLAQYNSRERAIDKINLFLNDKFYNYISLSRREVKILFHIYQNATSEIFELEEENQQLKSQLKRNNNVIEQAKKFVKEFQESFDCYDGVYNDMFILLDILNKRGGTDE